MSDREGAATSSPVISKVFVVGMLPFQWNSPFGWTIWNMMRLRQVPRDKDYFDAKKQLKDSKAYSKTVIARTLAWGKKWVEAYNVECTVPYKGDRN